MMDRVPKSLQALHHSRTPTAFQEKMWEQFASMGIQPRSERWKYFDFYALFNESCALAQHHASPLSQTFIHQLERYPQSDALIVCVNGQLNTQYSRLHELNLETANQPFVSSSHPEWYSILNHSFSEKFLKITIPSSDSKRVIRFIDIHDQAELTWNFFHVHIELTHHAKAILIEERWSTPSSCSRTTTCKTITLNSHAALHHAVLDGHTDSSSSCFSEVLVQQHDHSRYEQFNTKHRIQQSRDDIRVELNGVHAQCGLFGLIDSRDLKQCIDVHLDVIHSASYTQSEMFYKGVLDHQSKSIFNGALRVDPNCHHIEAYQGNHHVLLSTEAEAYSKPELQIYSDQIMCKHGATVGQLNSDALFYLSSRGIHQRDAMEILLSSFKEEVRNKLSSDLAEHGMNNYEHD